MTLFAQSYLSVMLELGLKKKKMEQNQMNFVQDVKASPNQQLKVEISKYIICIVRFSIK